MNTTTTLHFWKFLSNSDKLLPALLDNMTSSIENQYDTRRAQSMRAFGIHLERMFLVGRNKFHPALLKELKIRDLCAIYICSQKSESQIRLLLTALGWGRHAKIHIFEMFPTKKYFELMCSYDAIIFRKGSAPNDIDIHFF